VSGPEPSATEWLRRLEAEELSAVELATHQLELLEAADTRVAAVAAVDGDRVLGQAKEADARRAGGERAPLLGLPVTIKDSLAVAGMPHLSGSVAREGNVANEDATVVARLRAAGAIVLAKSAVPEYTWSYETESVSHGRTRNPYDPERTSGGSSGGEAALIASGASPLGLGTDGGGSIRVPSHYCGIAGLRPTARLVPETGAWPSTRDTGMLDMATIGPMARSVVDLALALDVIAGGDGIDPFVGSAPRRAPEAVDLRALRVAFHDEDGAWPSTPETKAAIRTAAELLGERGARVDEIEPPQITEATDLFFGMMAADGGAKARADLAPAGGRHIEQMAWLLDNLGEYTLSAEGFFELVGRWSILRTRLRLLFEDYDVVLSPVTPGPAPLHGCVPGTDETVETYLPWANVQAYSISGLPVAVVPVGTERGLPLGVHIAARDFRDDIALAAAAAVEEGTGGYAGVSWPLLAVSA
jgi:amidase